MKQDLDSLYYDRERLIEENEILAEQIQNFKPKPEKGDKSFFDKVREIFT